MSASSISPNWKWPKKYKKGWKPALVLEIREVFHPHATSLEEVLSDMVQTTRGYLGQITDNLFQKKVGCTKSK